MIRFRHGPNPRPNVRALFAALCAAGLAIAIAIAAPFAPDLPTAVASAALHATDATTATSAADEPWTAAPVGQFGGEVTALAVDEARALAWVAHGPRIVAIDMSDRAAPRVVGRSELLPERVSSLAVDGVLGLALVSSHMIDDPELLLTLDLADPTAPRVIATMPFDGPGSGGRIVIAGGMAFVKHLTYTYDSQGELLGSGYHLNAIDIHDPAAPRIVIADMLPSAGSVYDVKRVGNVLAVTTLGYPAQPRCDPNFFPLHLFDLTDPKHPRPAATMFDRAWHELGTGPGADHGAILYGFSKDVGVVALDVTLPDAPREVQRWPAAAEWSAGSFVAPDLLIDAAGAPYLVTGVGTGGYQVVAVDVPPDAPGRRRHYPLTGQKSAAALIGRHALVAELSGDISVIDTQTLTTTTSAAALVGSLRLLGTTTVIAMRQDLGDGLLYALTVRGGLTVLGLDRPFDPPVIGRYAQGASRDALQVAAGIATTGRFGSGNGAQGTSPDRTEVLDLADPTMPRLRNEFPNDRFARIAVAPDATWVVHGQYMGDGTQPPLTFSPAAGPMGGPGSELPLDVQLHDGTTVGGRFLSVGTFPASSTTCTFNRLALWDVPSASGPARRLSHIDVSRCHKASKNLHVAAAGSIAYVSDVLNAPNWPGIGSSQLFVVSTRDPLAPRVLAQLPLSGTVNHLAESHGYVFASAGWIAADHANVIVIDAHDPRAPRVIGSLAGTGGYVSVRDGRIYVSGSQSGVWVFEPPLDWSRPPHEDAWIALPWLGAMR